MKKKAEKVDFDLSTQTLTELIEIYDSITKFLTYAKEQVIKDSEELPNE